MWNIYIPNKSVASNVTPISGVSIECVMDILDMYFKGYSINTYFALNLQAPYMY